MTRITMIGVAVMMVGVTVLVAGVTVLVVGVYVRLWLHEVASLQLTRPDLNLLYGSTFLRN